MANKRQRAEARLDFLIGEAKDSLPLGLKKLYTEHSAKGLLKSGSTIKRSVAILDDLSRNQVDASLDAVSVATVRPGRKRQELLDSLENKTEKFVNDCEAHIANDLKKHGLDPKLMRPLVQKIRAKRADQIAQYAAEWTAPLPQSWRDRYRWFYDASLITVGAGITAAARWLFGI